MTEVLGSEEDDAEEESGDEPVEAAPKPRATRGMRASKAKGSAATPTKATARSAEEIEEPKVEVKVEIVRNIPPLYEVCCEGSGV